ncbi:TPA: hypothetical protein N0F65_000964 [Lagenidium giganteum]|uniref:Uncharacterized protein n=1 Tax=Lagenidium giganteum TaxID=4803 RepID=A0AAV2YYF2_9STRA|nr:TPA: hypothetical protein N0F65_000964 [Lagenidium giganteum]
MQPHEPRLTKVRQLMVRLGSIKHCHHLRQAGELMPVQDNATRRSRTYKMLQRFFDIINVVDQTDVALVDCIPTARKTMQLKLLYGDLQYLESVNKLLHCSNVF